MHSPLLVDFLSQDDDVYCANKPPAKKGLRETQAVKQGRQANVGQPKSIRLGLTDGDRYTTTTAATDSIIKAAEWANVKVVVDPRLWSGGSDCHTHTQLVCHIIKQWHERISAQSGLVYNRITSRMGEPTNNLPARVVTRRGRGNTVSPWPLLRCNS